MAPVHQHLLLELLEAASDSPDSPDGAANAATSLSSKDLLPLLKLLTRGRPPSIAVSARGVLRQQLLASRVFEENPGELDLWLECLPRCNVDSNEAEHRCSCCPQPTVSAMTRQLLCSIIVQLASAVSVKRSGDATASIVQDG